MNSSPFLIKISDFIDKSRIYYIIPIITVIFLLNHIYTTCNSLFCNQIDVRTFYFGIINSIFYPDIAYEREFYLANGAWIYLYTPFFALLFYPMTLWGIVTFERIFFIGGLVCLGIALLLCDEIMRKKKITWGYRAFLLLCMSMGRHFLGNYYIGQKNLYVLLAIVLIIYAEQEEWNPLIIHFLFMVIISMMTHLVFWYIYFLFKQGYGIQSKNPTKNKRYINRSQWRIMLPNIRPFIIGGLFFVATNCLFIIHPQLIVGYYNETFVNFAFEWGAIHDRSENALIPYALFTLIEAVTGAHMLVSVMSIIAFVILTLNLIRNHLKIDLLESLGWNLVILLLFDPLIEDHYFIFIFAGLLLWIAHNISFLKGPPYLKALDMVLFMIIFYLIKTHLEQPIQIRNILYFIFVCIIIIERLLIRPRAMSLDEISFRDKEVKI